MVEISTGVDTSAPSSNDTPRFRSSESVTPGTSSTAAAVTVVAPGRSAIPVTGNTPEMLDGRPFPPNDTRVVPPRLRGCIANDAFGEGCYFRDAIVCVGFGNRLRVGLVVNASDPLLKAPQAVSGGHGRMEFRYFQHAPVTPHGYKSGLHGSNTPYLGTAPDKLWKDMVSGSK